jgi:hypothetical protein
VRRRGAEDDERPAVELWGAEPQTLPTQRVELGANRSPRLPVVAAVVVVLGLIGLGLGLGDSSDGPGDDDPTSAEAGREEQGDKRDEQAADAEDTTTTTRRRRPTTTTAPTTTIATGPVFWWPTGAGLLTSATGERWTWVDLDTGERRDVELGTSDPWMTVPVLGGVVHLGHGTGEAIYQPLPDGEAVVLGEAEEVLATEDPTLVWLLRHDGSSGGPSVQTQAQLVGLDGDAAGDEVVLTGSYPQAATTEGLIFAGGGRAFQQDGRGVRSLGIGDVLDVRGTSVVLGVCDEQATCRPEVLDLFTGARVVYPPLPTTAPYSHLVELIAGGGLLVAEFPADGLGRMKAVLYDGAGREWGRIDMPGPANNGTAWLPGTGGALLPDGDGFLRVHDADGELVTTPVPGLADLPSSWVYIVPR